MRKKEKLEKERYQIIKPFLDSEKSLKKISEDEDISYSTLKRWVSYYKKNGINGLKKNIRKDKNTYRSVDKKTIKYVEKVYKENPDIKIQDLYEKVVNFIKKMGGKKVSYDTVYRIANKLDPFVKKYAENYSFKSSESNEVFGFTSSFLDIKILDETSDEMRNPYLNIVYDTYSKAICSYFISFEQFSLDEVLQLFRVAILDDELNSFKIYGKPREFVINNIRIQERKRLEEIKRDLDIEINFSSNEGAMQEFYIDLNEIYLKDIVETEKINLDYTLLNFKIKDYIESVHNFRTEEKWANGLKELRVIPNKNMLDMLLSRLKSDRKIQNYGVRFQNLLYNNDEFGKYIGENVELVYNSFDVSSVKVYRDGVYLGTGYCKELLGIQLSLYELMCIKRYISVNYYNKTFSSSIYIKEVMEMVKEKYL